MVRETLKLQMGPDSRQFSLIIVCLFNSGCLQNKQLKQHIVDVYFNVHPCSSSVWCALAQVWAPV